MTDNRLTQVGADVLTTSSQGTTSNNLTQVGVDVLVAEQGITQIYVTQIGVSVLVSSTSTLRGRSFSTSSARLGSSTGTAALSGKNKLTLTAHGSIDSVLVLVGIQGRSPAMLMGSLGAPSVPPPSTPPLFDWRLTVISQYANSPILLKLLENFDDYIDPTVDFDAFFFLIWNVDTAQNYGLDVWGRIVGVTRTLEISDIGKAFGFEEAGNDSADPFNQSPFWGGTGATHNFRLSDNAFRTLIFAKALANISDGSIPSINQLLINLFGSGGNAYVTDGGNMTMTYKFEFALSPVQLAIISQSGVLPKPVGVLATVDAP